MRTESITAPARVPHYGHTGVIDSDGVRPRKSRAKTDTARSLRHAWRSHWRVEANQELEDMADGGPCWELDKIYDYSDANFDVVGMAQRQSGATPLNPVPIG